MANRKVRKMNRVGPQRASPKWDTIRRQSNGASLHPQQPKGTVDFIRRQGKDLVEEGKRLTAWQREVLQLLAEGKSMKDVASALNITTRTVAFHKYRIMEVLNAKSNAELVQTGL